MSLIRKAGCLVAIMLMAGCASVQTFVETIDPSWDSVGVRTGVPYDQSWDRSVDYLVKRFDLEVLSRADGYIRTSWNYSWNGKLEDSYRVRVTLKFTPDRKTLEIKTEAEKGGPGHWILGTDTRLTDAMSTDLAALIGNDSNTGEVK